MPLMATNQSVTSVAAVCQAWARLKVDKDYRLRQVQHQQKTSKTTTIVKPVLLTLRGVRLDQVSVEALCKLYDKDFAQDNNKKNPAVPLGRVCLQECTFANAAAADAFFHFLHSLGPALQELLVMDKMHDYQFVMKEECLVALLDRVPVHLPHLQRFALSHASLSGPNVAQRLKRLCRDCCQLRHLSLPGCSMDDTCFAALLQGLQQKSETTTEKNKLQRLNLAACKLDNERLQSLSQALAGDSGIQELCLTENPLLTPSAFQEGLTTLLRETPSLQELRLAGCRNLFRGDDTNDAVKFFSCFTQALADDNTTLTCLDVCHCDLSQQHASLLLQALHRNATLQTLLLLGNPKAAVHPALAAHLGRVRGLRTLAADELSGAAPPLVQAFWQNTSLTTVKRRQHQHLQYDDPMQRALDRNRQLHKLPALLQAWARQTEEEQNQQQPPLDWTVWPSLVHKLLNETNDLTASYAFVRNTITSRT